MQSMKLRLSDPAQVDELLRYLQRHETITERTSRTTVTLSLPDVEHDDAARLALELYVRAFEQTHPGTTVHRIA